MTKHSTSYLITRTITRAIFYTLITAAIIYACVFIT